MISAGRKWSGVILIVLSVLVCTVAVFPIYWMANMSIKLERELFAHPPQMLPTHPDFSGYTQSFRSGNILLWVKNSLLVTLIGVFLNLCASSLGAFGLSRFDFKANKIIVFVILTTQMIAPALLVGPIYMLFTRVKLTNSLFGLAFVNSGMTLAFSTWILKGFMDSIPRELDEAAHIDGCSRFQVFVKIVFPLSISAIISVVVLTFFDIYNEYMFALTLITDQSKWLGTVGIASNTTRMGTPWNLMLAQTALFCIVPILFYFTFQRYIVRGLTSGALKF